MSANKDSVLRTLTVALLVCLVCAVVVATAAVMLRPVQEKNKLLDKQMNILAAAGLYEQGMDVPAAFENIERRFVELESSNYVEKQDSYEQRRAAKAPPKSMRLDGGIDNASIKRQARWSEVYLARGEQGGLSKMTLPIHGYGLLSTLYGFIALQPDANTIACLGFY